VDRRGDRAPRDGRRGSRGVRASGPRPNRGYLSFLVAIIQFVALKDPLAAHPWAVRYSDAAWSASEQKDAAALLARSDAQIGAGSPRSR